MKGGFRITGNGKHELPERIDVQVAYGGEGGNSFNSYHEFDFDLEKEPISISSLDAEFKARENQLEIVPRSPTFSIEVYGFDVQRDLDIDLKP